MRDLIMDSVPKDRDEKRKAQHLVGLEAMTTVTRLVLYHKCPLNKSNVLL